MKETNSALGSVEEQTMGLSLARLLMSPSPVVPACSAFSSVWTMEVQNALRPAVQVNGI